MPGRSRGKKTDEHKTVQQEDPVEQVTEDKIKKSPRKRKRSSIKPEEIDDDAAAEEESAAQTTPKKRVRRAKKDILETNPKAESEDEVATETAPKKQLKAAKKETEHDQEEPEATEGEPKKKRQRRPKKTEPEEPLKMRTQGLKMMLGAHVSMAKSISNSIINANHIGANSFALFLKNQRKWISPDMKPEDIEEFKSKCQEFGYDPQKDILPHGSYLINLANDDETKQKQGYDCFLDDLKRCEALNIGRYNFHPGSTASCTREKGIENVAKNINKAIAETTSVKIVVENMAGHGNIIGGPFEELAAIIDQVEDKSRIGVCLDTCHLYAAGHDLRTQEAYDHTFAQFDKIVGMKYLAGMHLNDSKADLGANKDLHQNIGLGYLGLEAFRCVMNDTRLEGLPLILETPCENEEKKEDKSIYPKEIELLEWLIGRSSDDPEVLAKHEELQELGAGSREKALVAAKKKADRIEKMNSPKKPRKKKEPESD